MRTAVLSAFLFVSLLAASAAAHAQASVYVTWSNAHLDSVPSTVGTTTQPETYWASGIGGGVTVNVLPFPIVSLGIDLRGSTRSGNDGADTALGGIKLGVHPPGLPVKLYIQGSAGYLAARPSSGVTNKYGVYEVLGGVDYPLVHFVDLRIIELGAGKAVIGTTSSNNPTLFTINTGLVLHF